MVPIGKTPSVSEVLTMKRAANLSPRR